MSREYVVEPMSRFKAKVGDGVIRETATRRIVFRPEIVDNQNDPHATVHGRLMYQRRRSAAEPWQDDGAFRLSKVKQGEAVVFSLDADETRALYLELDRLYQLPIHWAVGESRRYVVVDPDQCYIATGKERELIEQLLKEEGEEFWNHIEMLSPGLINTVALKREHEARKEIVSEFAEHLDENDWTEPDWHRFFEDNAWIFGHNLLFQFLNQIGSEVHVGGKTLSGRGGQDVDFMLNTEADARFTVFVDIKKPATGLVRDKLYRNSVHHLGEELTAGVSQVQSYCRRWVIEGSDQESNREKLRDAGIYTYEPRGIVVVGHCRQLNTQDKRATFELFRRNLHNPEIITFDELFARAYFTVHQTAPRVVDYTIPHKFQD